MAWKNKMLRNANTAGTVRKLMILGVVTIAAILSAAVAVLPEKSNNVVLPTKLMPPALIP
jgi:hypothetical protein